MKFSVTPWKCFTHQAHTSPGTQGLLITFWWSDVTVTTPLSHGPECYVSGTPRGNSFNFSTSHPGPKEDVIRYECSYVNVILSPICGFKEVIISSICVFPHPVYDLCLPLPQERTSVCPYLRSWAADTSVTRCGRRWSSHWECWGTAPHQWPHWSRYSGWTTFVFLFWCKTLGC